MIWNSLENTVEEALVLPEGTLVVNFGFSVHQSIDPDELLDLVDEVQKIISKFEQLVRLGYS